jgi:hypothetical protein
MAALFAVVNESIAIVESISTKLENLSVIEVAHGFHENEQRRTPPILTLIVLDIPSLHEDYEKDPYFFGFVFNRDQSASYDGGFIDVSYDGGLSWDLGRVEFEGKRGQATIGFVVDDPATGDRELGNPKPDRWDVYSQVTVEMASGELKSATKEEVYAGANLVRIDGEIRAFLTATEVTPLGIVAQGKTYRLTTWIRGLRGTTPIDPTPKEFPGSGGRIKAQPLVIDLTSPFVPVRIQTGDDATPLHYRARAREYDLEAGVELLGERDLTVLGENLRLLPPINVVAVQEANLDWTITFDPVSRTSRPQLFSARGVQDPDPETFDIQILESSGSETVVRTIPVTAQAATYTVAQQTADFGDTENAIFVTVLRTGSWIDSETTEEITG